MSFRARITATSGLLVAATFIAAPLALFSGLAIAPLLGIVLALAIAEGIKKKFIEFPSDPITFVIILFAAWAFASSFWAVDPQESLENWSKTFTLLLLALIAWPVFRQVSTQYIQAMAFALWAGLLLTLFLVLVEIAGDGALYNWFRESFFSAQEELFNPETYNRGACFLAIIFWPWLMHAVNAGKHNNMRMVWIGLLWVLVLVAISTLESLSAKLAFIGASVVYVLVLFVPRFSTRLLSMAVLASIIAIPLLSAKIDPLTHTNDGLPPSAMHRLIIWDFVHTKAMEKPAMGWGFASSKLIPGGQNRVELPNQSTPEKWTYLPRHPHDAVMHVWLELGIPGLVLYAAILLMALVWVGRYARTNNAKAAMLACFTCYYGISLTAFSVWQEWWVATALFAALLLQTFMVEFRDSAGHKLVYKTRL